MSLPQWGIIARQWRVILEIARRYLDFLVAEGGVNCDRNVGVQETATVTL